MGEPADPKDTFGLTNVVAQPLARVPIRARDRAFTTSAWRLDVASDQGPGGIVFADPYYRGEGVFLGWPQDRLVAAYRAFQTSSEPDSDQFIQLG